MHAHQNKRRLRDNIIAAAGVILVAGLAATTQIFYFTAGPGAPTPEPSASATGAPAAGTNVGAPDPTISEYRTWTGQMVLNGDITLGIELDGLDAPQATAGFIVDSESGYYSGKTCHRLATSQGFSLIQCGSIDGVGGPDASFSYGPVENAPADNIYPAGTIAMARSGNDGYSNGHQFFIVTDSTTLPTDAAGGYTVVGHVTTGLEQLIDQVTSKGVDPATQGTDGTGQPLVPTIITKVTLQ